MGALGMPLIGWGLTGGTAKKVQPQMCQEWKLREIIQVA